MRADVKALQVMIDSMVGIEKFAYPSRQNEAPKPKEEFAHITLLEEYQIGLPTNDIVEQTDETTTYRTISPAKLRFRVGVVDTVGIASSKIMHGWTSEAMKALMISTGYGFISCHPLSNEDAKLEKEWDFRQGFSVEMYTTRVYDQVVDNILQLEISGEFVTPQLDTILLQININEN
jgi:hypothetical protein|tara:strand:- start:4292 stop:4822 length:531 start_codon:yes stop_codon:yes gene_type:complete